MSKPKYTVPVSKKGMPHYVPAGSTDDCYHGKIRWVAPEPFKATLTLRNYARGRSAAYFMFVSEQGLEYGVFMVDFTEMVMSALWHRGAITADFMPVKRGSNYGVKLASGPTARSA